MKKKVLWSIAAAVLLATGGSTIYFKFFAPQYFPKNTAYIYIDRNDNIDSVYNKIQQKGNVRSSLGWKYIAKYKDYSNNIHTGKYAIKKGDTHMSLINRLLYGYQTPSKLMIPSVRSVEALSKKLSNQLMIDSTEIANIFTDSLMLDSLGMNNQTILALPIPNTYEVYWNSSAEIIKKRLIKEYNKFWNNRRRAKADSLKLTPFEVATLASIVTEETANNAEKPTIAGLYINRLNKGMLLQADPTVRFANYDFSRRRVLRIDLKKESPYNTYLHKGLPPGPIRIASPTDIDAVLNAEKHNYIFMCAKEDFSGTHNFAVTFREHKNNAKRYWKELNKRKIYK